MNPFTLTLAALAALVVGLIIVLQDGEIRMLREINRLLEERAGLRGRKP